MPSDTTEKLCNVVFDLDDPGMQDTWEAIEKITVSVKECYEELQVINSSIQKAHGRFLFHVCCLSFLSLRCRQVTPRSCTFPRSLAPCVSRQKPLCLEPGLMDFMLLSMTQVISCACTYRSEGEPEEITYLRCIPTSEGQDLEGVLNNVRHIFLVDKHHSFR